MESRGRSESKRIINQNKEYKAMSFSDDEDEDNLPLPKKQRIYYGSLEEKLKHIASDGNDEGPNRPKFGNGDLGDGDENDSEDDSDEDDGDDAIARAIRAGNINIAEGNDYFTYVAAPTHEQPDYPQTEMENKPLKINAL